MEEDKGKIKDKINLLNLVLQMKKINNNPANKLMYSTLKILWINNILPIVK